MLRNTDSHNAVSARLRTCAYRQKRRPLARTKNYHNQLLVSYISQIARLLTPLAVALGLMGPLQPLHAATPSADTIYVGEIVTMAGASDDSRAEAVAVAGERIIDING